MTSLRQAPFVVCYLCGRKYGTRSIKIHEPSCLKKWHAENKKLPKHLRRKQPPVRPDYNQLSSGNVTDEIMDRMNEMSYQAAKAQLIPCEYCSRTFLPERLIIHHKSCTSENPSSAPKLGAKINGVRISKNAGTANIIKSAKEEDEKYDFLNHRPLTSHGAAQHSTVQSFTKRENTMNSTIKKAAFNKMGKRENTMTLKSNSSAENEKYIKCSFCEVEIHVKKIKNHLMKCNKEEKIPCGLCNNNIPISQIQNHLVICNATKIQQMKLNTVKSTRLNSSSSCSDDEVQERPSTRTLHRRESQDTLQREKFLMSDLNDTSQSSKSNSQGRTIRTDNDLDFKTGINNDKRHEEKEMIKCRKCSEIFSINQMEIHRCETKREEKYNQMNSPKKGSYPNYPTYDKDSDADEDNFVLSNEIMIECNICNRKFSKERVETHKSICLKNKQKKRKIFNSSKQRNAGSEPNAVPKNSTSLKKAPESNWRQTHQDFINSIRAAKKAKAHVEKGGKLTDLPPPPPSLNPDYVHCKYCNRKFNPIVAERHIPKCANTISRPKPPKQRAVDVFASKNFQGKNKINNKPNEFSSNAKKKKLSHSQRNSSQAFATKSGISPRYDDFTSPFSEELPKQPLSKQINRPSTTKRGEINRTSTSSKGKVNRPSTSSHDYTNADPYKSKIFTGIGNIKGTKTNVGYSYNAMNKTNSSNFFC